MKRSLKIAIGAVVVLVAVAVAAVALLQANRGHIAEQAVVQATGNEQAASVAAKVAEGEDLSDDEIRSALGVDEETYGLVKDAADGLGIDLNDSTQLQELVMSNLGNLDFLQGLADGMADGTITSSEQVQELLSENLKLPGQEDGR